MKASPEGRFALRFWLSCAGLALIAWTLIDLAFRYLG